MAATYRARFVLIGSMNPEEGRLRPQIMDRFGLRVVARGLPDPSDRLEAYRRSVAYRQNPRQVVEAYAEATVQAQLELTQAREALSRCQTDRGCEQVGLKLIQELDIDSLRAEITLFEAAAPWPWLTAERRLRRTISGAWPPWRSVCAGHTSWVSSSRAKPKKKMNFAALWTGRNQVNEKRGHPRPRSLSSWVKVTSCDCRCSQPPRPRS